MTVPPLDSAERIEKIVIHMPNWLGDTIMAFPLVSAIRAACTQASINVVARPSLAPLWDSFPEVDEVLSFDRFAKQHRLQKTLKFVRDLKSRNYDAAIILPVGVEFALFYFLAGVRIRIAYAHAQQGFLVTHALPVDTGFRTRHLAESYAAICRVFGKELQSVSNYKAPSLPAPAADALTHFGLVFGQRCVLLHVWSAYGPAKRWPLERFAELGDRLYDSHNVQVILVGSEEAREASHKVVERMSQPALNLCGRTSICELVGLTSAASLVVSTDSGPAHVAAALDVPVVTLFGSSSPDWTRPLGIQSKFIYRGLECSPCFQQRCPLGTYDCFWKISVDEVWGTAAKLLDEPPC